MIVIIYNCFLLYILVGEIMLGQLMSAINTDQIILAKDGFAWDTVRKYMEKGESYVKSTVIDSAVVKSEINDFERFYLLQKIYLYSNVGINKKRKQVSLSFFLSFVLSFFFITWLQQNKILL